MDPPAATSVQVKKELALPVRVARYTLKMMFFI
jgi:hypothetical protein